VYMCEIFTRYKGKHKYMKPCREAHKNKANTTGKILTNPQATRNKLAEAEK